LYVVVNKEIAERRLPSLLTKLKARRKLEQYQKKLDECLALGIIEEDAEEDNKHLEVTYLPVFVASATQKEK